MGLQRVRLSEHACIRTHTHTGSSLSYIKYSGYSVPPFACVYVCAAYIWTLVYPGTSQKDSNPPNSGCLWGKLCLEFRGGKKPYFVHILFCLVFKNKEVNNFFIWPHCTACGILVL